MGCVMQDLVVLYKSNARLLYIEIFDYFATLETELFTRSS